MAVGVQRVNAGLRVISEPFSAILGVEDADMPRCHVSIHDRSSDVWVWDLDVPARRVGGTWLFGSDADIPSADEFKDDWTIVQDENLAAKLSHEAETALGARSPQPADTAPPEASPRDSYDPASITFYRDVEENCGPGTPLFEKNLRKARKERLSREREGRGSARSDDKPAGA